MRARSMIVALIGVAAAGTALVAPAASAAPAAGGTTIRWEMNEGHGARTMHDANGHESGSIGSEVQTGTTYNGATGYTFGYLKPNTPPTHPQHLVTAHNSSLLNPGNGSWSIEIRYRTTHAFGNLIQKGQSTTSGGQFKIQLPGGRPQCYFKSSAGRDGVGYRTPINNGHWHTLRCVKTANSVTLYVDGVQRGRKTGPIGKLTNSYPLSIGGKTNCNQKNVTCDYFAGQVDYVHITKG